MIRIKGIGSIVAVVLFVLSSIFDIWQKLGDVHIVVVICYILILVSCARTDIEIEN